MMRLTADKNCPTVCANPGSHSDQNPDPKFDPKRNLILIEILTPSLAQNGISFLIKALTTSLIQTGSHFDQNSDPAFDTKRDLILIKILTPRLDTKWGLILIKILTLENQWKIFPKSIEHQLKIN